MDEGVQATLEWIKFVLFGACCSQIVGRTPAEPHAQSFQLCKHHAGVLFFFFKIIAFVSTLIRKDLLQRSLNAHLRTQSEPLDGVSGQNRLPFRPLPLEMFWTMCSISAAKASRSMSSSQRRAVRPATMRSSALMFQRCICVGPFGSADVRASWAVRLAEVRGCLFSFSSWLVWPQFGCDGMVVISI